LFARQILSKMKINENAKNEDSTFEELKWKFALQNSGIGLWDWNSKTSKVFYSKESKQIIGFNEDEISSEASEWDKRVHRDDIDDYYEDFNNHINGDNPEYKNIHRILHKDNTYRWILDQGKIIEYDDNGKPVRIIGTHTDITKQKETERSLKKSIDLITVQNNRLQSFAHIVSHNLKEYASNFESIITFHDEADTQAEKQEMFRHLRTVSKALSKTLLNLRQIVSVQSKKHVKGSVISVSHEVNLAVNDLSYLIAESSTILYNNVEHDCNICFSSSYFQSIMHNLITNAIKYKHPDRKPEITISSNCTKDNLELTITDNGLGLDLDRYGNEVFGLYKTFHKNKDAEGVGLYLIKSQLEAFGGTITINSTKDVGSTFNIIIPKQKKIQL